MPLTRPVTRRDFIKRAAATSIAAPYIVSATAWGRGAPSERITLGMIGVGNMGRNHVNGFTHNSDVRIRAICDVHQGRRDAARNTVAEAYGGDVSDIAGYNDYESVIERDDIDAVVIATPDHWHALIAIAACRAGKDVYCEKPLSLTVREAWQMVDAARRYGRVFQTGSQQRSSANFRLACELVRSGRVGNVQTVHVGVDGPSYPKFLPEEPRPDGFDWDRWLGPTPWYPYNSERCSGDYGGGWRRIRDYSGGMMTDWGAHHFDIAQWGLGMDGSGPVEIIPPNIADEGTLTYRYANGVMMYHGGANGVLFTGPDGKIEVNRGHFETGPETIGKKPLGPYDVHLYESPGHHVDWINCVRSRRRPICDVEIGASSATVCHLGNIAWWLGRTLKWDPKIRTIVGDEAASRWLDRPKRAPWQIHV